jgi:hypothetical protein
MYIDVLYIMCAICIFSNFSCAGYIVFMQKKLQHMITYDGCVSRHKLIILIYVGPAQPS